MPYLPHSFVSLHSCLPDGVWRVSWCSMLALIGLLLLPVIGAAQVDPAAAVLNWRAGADKLPPPIMTIGRCSKPPVIDGKIEPGEWDDACAIATLSAHDDALTPTSPIVYVMYDAHKIYFAYIRYKPTPGWFEARSRFHDSATYMDPHIELFLSPDPGAAPDLVYQFCINAYGAVYDVLKVPAFGRTELGYNPKIDFKTSETQSEWCLEGSIDVKDLDPQGRFADGAVWRGNFCWAWPQLAWSQVGIFWIERSNMGVLHLNAFAPALQWLNVEALHEGNLDVRVGVKNLAETAQTYIVSTTVSGESTTDMLAKAQQTVTLQPRERQEFTLHDENTFAGKRGHALFRCTSADGKTLYYQQYVRLSGKDAGMQAQREAAMQQTVPMPKTLDLSCRYGPLSKAVEVQADVWFLRRNGITPDKVRLSIVSAANPDQPLLSQEIAKFQKDLALYKFDLPADLPYGKYLVKAQALAQDGSVIMESQQPFTHIDLTSPDVNKAYQGRAGHILDWIGTKSGVATKVPPPWTPISGNPGTGLEVLNRKAFLEPSGLPKQITAVGEPLLAGPIRYVAMVDGKAMPLTAGKAPGQFSIDAPGMTACWEGVQTSPVLTLTTSGTMEYDGLINYRLAITCPQPVKLDALYLDIPVRKALAERMTWPSSNALLPAGNGLIWKSKDIVDNELMNTLVSHVWIGNWKCGIAFVADQTRGWYEKMDESLETIERGKDAVHLRVYFVQGPQTISSTSLQFALMATPGTTRPAGWRMYPEFNNRNYFWLMDMNDSATNERRGSGNPVWDWDDPTPAQIDILTKQDMANSKTLGLPYTNPWFHYPFVVPWELDNGSPVPAIVMEDWANMPTRWGFVRPVASERDYMLYNYEWYFKLKHFAGFYIDEAYGAEGSDINMLNGSGWIDRDGNLRGSYHSMDVRELFKRQYVLGMQYSPLGTPFMLNHTSWGESPQYSSFVTAGILVENMPLAAGECYLDHLPLSSLQFWNGRAWGNFSTTNQLGPDEKSRRYCSGELMLHDMPYSDPNSNDPSHVLRRKFNMGANDITFYGYWEEPRVVTSSDAGIKASVYQRPGEALVVVCNVDTKTEYQATLQLALKALGLPAKATARDYETGLPVPIEAGKIAVRLAPRDVQYLYVSGK